MYISRKLLKVIYRLLQLPLLCIGFLLLTVKSSLAFDIDGSQASLSNMQALDINESLLLDNDILEIQLTAYGQAYTFVLSENSSLLKNALPSVSASDSKPYEGYIEGVDKSWVRLTNVDGNYIGAFFDGTELFFVDLADKAVTMTDDITLRNEIIATGIGSVIFSADSINDMGQCALDSGTGSTGFEYSKLLDSVSIDDSVFAASASREIEVTIVADSEYLANSGSDIPGNILAQMNIVDGIFTDQLGLTMSVAEIVQLTSNGALTSTSASTLIVDFRSYVASEIGNKGLTHLFTGKNLDGSTAGIAYLGGVCGSFGVGVTQAGNMSSIASLVAAHEFGHNLGAPHDNQSGSSCAATDGSFLMNPSINGNDQFSACSLSIIQPVVNGASCIVDVTPVADTPPTIISSANLNATTNTVYQYDDNNQLEADGSVTIAYQLDFGPTGMTVDSEGVVSWTPSEAQLGTNSVQITATNSFGTDTQSFDVEVASPPDTSVFNFNETPPNSYAGSEQDVTGLVTVEDGGATLRIQGNRWKKVDLDYTVTADTILEFDFKSNAEGEVHAIGLDNNLTINENKTFNLYGTQKYGIDTYQYSGSGDYEHFVIPVGDFIGGNMTNVFFATDHDIESPTGESYFSNVQIYEAGQVPIIIPPTFASTPNLSATADIPYDYDSDNTVNATGTGIISYTLNDGPVGMSLSPDGVLAWTPELDQEGENFVQITATNSAGSDIQQFEVVVSVPISESVLDFNATPPKTYGGSAQDVEGIISIEDGGATLVMTGNLWKRVDFDYTLTYDTVIRFEFKSTSQGEVHAIGFDNNFSIDGVRTFGIYGTQNYGQQNFRYTGSGEYQQFEIPVGDFYQGKVLNIFFGMDDDVSNPVGNSYFKNIQVIEN